MTPTIEVSNETANMIRRAIIVEIIPADWMGRCAVLDAPSPDHAGPLTLTIPPRTRGFEVGREIAYTLAPSTIQQTDLDGKVSRVPVRGRTDVHVLMAGNQPAS